MKTNGRLLTTIEFRVLDGFTLLILRGDCDDESVSVDKGLIEGFINRGYKVLLVDLTDLRFVSRLAFIALDDCCTQMYHAGGRLILINPEEEAREVIKQAPFSRGCVVVESIEEALSWAKKKAA
ncbi:MAG: STAS domain-containing protein [Candidatus Aquicultorales bacterium]